MTPKSTPELLRHAPGPDARDFALLSGAEATTRALVVSVLPILAYRAWQDAGVVSHLYLIVGILSLVLGLSIPWITTKMPRRWLYTIGALCHLAAAVCGFFGGTELVTLAVALHGFAIVICFVCLNAYLLDYISRNDIGKAESKRMTFVATPWTFGPALSVWLMDKYPPAPFIASGISALILLIVFWKLRLGDGKAISKAKRDTVNPLIYIGHFLQQPRLIVGYCIALIKSGGWWVYTVYLPIFCVQNGLGEQIAGYVFSLSNATLYASPLVLYAAQKYSIRRVIQFSFFMSGALLIAAAFAAPMPMATVILFYLGTTCFSMLDVTGGVPFLSAVRPSERTEMAAVYSTFRDVSGSVAPAVAGLVLLFAPVQWVFAACGVSLWGAGALASTLHPRLGQRRKKSA